MYVPTYACIYMYIHVHTWNPRDSMEDASFIEISMRQEFITAQKKH